MRTFICFACSVTLGERWKVWFLSETEEELLFLLYHKHSQALDVVDLWARNIEINEVVLFSSLLD